MHYQLWAFKDAIEQIGRRKKIKYKAEVAFGYGIATPNTDVTFFQVRLVYDQDLRSEK